MPPPLPHAPGMRRVVAIAELCRKEGIAQSLYYTWSKEFMEAGKRRLAGDTARAATSDEVKDLRREASALKECVADQTLKNRILLENYFLPGDLERQIEAFVEHYNHQRYHESLDKRHARRCLLWQGLSHHRTTRKDQATDHRTSALAAPQARRPISTPGRGQHSANLRTNLRQMF